MVHQNRELLFNKTCVVLFLASVTRSVAESIIAVRLSRCTAAPCASMRRLIPGLATCRNYAIKSALQCQWRFTQRERPRNLFF
jgi:hypothetical protein